MCVHSHSHAIRRNTKHAWWGHGQSRMTGANGSELMLSVEVNFIRLPLHLEYQVWVWHSDGQLHKTHETTRTRKEWFQPWFYFCNFLIAHRTFTPGKQRYDRKEGNKSKSMPQGSSCLIAQRCHRIFLWVRHKHTSRVGGERRRMKAQNERCDGATQNLKEQNKLRQDAMEW